MKKALLIIFLLSLICCEKSTHKAIKSEENSSYKKAWFFLDHAKKDSAFYYFNLAKEDYLKKKDSFSAGKCLVNMAIIQEDASDSFGGMETSMDALSFLKEKDTAHHSFLATNYNNIGVCAGNLQDYKQSEYFYRKALNFTKDPEEKIMFLNNLANTLHQKKDYIRAETIFQDILAKIDDKHYTYPRVLTNLARTKWYQNHYFDPIPAYREALNMYLKDDDLWGLDISYANLSDYYMDDDKTKALDYANKMYAVATQLNSPVDRLEALQKIIKLENASNVKKYFAMYQKLDDSLHVVNLKTKNQYALIRYDTEKNKSDKLKLQKENIANKYEIILHQTIITLIILAALILFFVLLMGNKRKQVRVKLEAENLIKENKLKTSKKVHDVVANGLYRVMTELENDTEIDRNKILYKLEDMYEKSRNISYEEELESKISFSDKISQMIQSFDSDSVRLFIVGNSEEFWDHVDVKSRHEIFHVLQELMVNMKKHSEASRVILKFSTEDKLCKIDYSDNGIGINEPQFAKNGLRNTGNRIFNIKGQIIFETNNNSGLKINISFPSI